MHRIEMLNGNKEFCQEFLTDVRVPDTRPDRRGRRRLDGRHPLDVPRADGVQLAARHHARRARCTPAAVARSVRASPSDAGRLDDPQARDLIGEARMLDLVGARAQAPHRPGHHDRDDVRPGLGHRPAVRRPRGGPAHHHRLRARRRAPARRGPTTTATLAGVRQRLPDAPGGLHRRRHHRDGRQRHQRAGARACPGSAPSTATSPSATSPGAPHTPELSTTSGVDLADMRHRICGQINLFIRCGLPVWRRRLRTCVWGT